MNQLVRMGVMFAILLGIALYALLSSPDPEAESVPASKPTPTPISAKSPAQARPAPVVKRAPRPEPPPVEDAPEVDAEPPESPDDAALPQGPFVFGLGEHRILLVGEGRRFLRIGVELVVDSKKTQDEVRRRRNHLVRMLFFLCSKRKADGTEGDAGRERLKQDLGERFGNTIKTGNITEIRFTRFELTPSQSADAGAE